MPPLLTVEEAAEILRIGRNTCYELVRQGQIPHLRLGRLIRVPKHALMSWLGEQPDAYQQPAAPSFPQRH
jgi:excisionase family DNA binding protein